MDVKKLRSRRVEARISGHAVCSRVGKSRSWLSDVENGHAIATPDELAKIDEAINQIISTRRQVESMAASAGLSLAGVL